MNTITAYQVAQKEADFDLARQLFKEYSDSLGFDLSFQDFETELIRINIQYGKPEGALIIARVNQLPAGCVGIRKLDTQTAELKRMYVKPEYRGLHIGVELLKLALASAAELQYDKIRLDTVQHMSKARSIYKSFGFYEIPSYRFSPLEGAVYMERLLQIEP